MEEGSRFMIESIDSDAELMQRLAEGDESVFGVLLARHRGSVVRYLYRMVSNHPVAETASIRSISWDGLRRLPSAI